MRPAVATLEQARSYKQRALAGATTNAVATTNGVASGPFRESALAGAVAMLGDAS